MVRASGLRSRVAISTLAALRLPRLLTSQLSVRPVSMI
jgi:hypothetical protein